MLFRTLYTARLYVAAKRAAVRAVGLRRGLRARVRVTWINEPGLTVRLVATWEK